MVDAKGISESFVNSFTNIEPNISKKYLISPNRFSPNSNSFYLYPTNYYAINKIFKNFKNGKPSAPCSIPNSKILKFNFDILFLPISNLTKMCFTVGVFP